MKRLLLFLFLIPALAFSQQQKISDMPTYIGNPNGSWVPIVQNGTNRKVNAAYFGYNKVDSMSTSFGGIYDTVYVWKFGIKSFYFLTRASGGGGSTAWADITGRPNTLAGYSITDAAALSHTHTFASLTSKPTTLAGYGITDAAGAITLTTSGTSGAATLSGGVLNIPNYAGGGGGGSGDASTNTSSSIDNELALFSGTGGKTIKRATATGLPILSNGVLSALGLGANGTYLKVVGGTLQFVNDSASIPVGPSLDYTNGLLGISASAGTALYKSVTISSSSYTVAAGIKTVFCNYTGGTLTVTLPTSPTIDDRVTIQNRSSNNVSVTPVLTGFQNLLVQYNQVTYQWDGTSWSVVGK